MSYVINKRFFNHRYKQRMRMRAMLRRHGQVCPYCNTLIVIDQGYNHPLAPSRDHVIPLARGGMDKLENMIVSHRACNEKKGMLLPDEFQAWIEGRASRLDVGPNKLP